MPTRSACAALQKLQRDALVRRHRRSGSKRSAGSPLAGSTQVEYRPPRTSGEVVETRTALTEMASILFSRIRRRAFSTALGALGIRNRLNAAIIGLRFLMASGTLPAASAPLRSRQFRRAGSRRHHE